MSPTWREHRWLAGRSAMYLPGVPRRGETGLRSTLAIGMERDRLEQVAHSVAPRRRVGDDPSGPRPPRPVLLAQCGF